MRLRVSIRAVLSAAVAAVVAALAVSPCASVFACSNVLIAGRDLLDPAIVHAAVARSMDFEQFNGDGFGYGAIGDENTARVNMPQGGPFVPVKWTTRYAFIGQSAAFTSYMTDGLNTEGLYAGLLELPGISRYPKYDPEDARPELGVLDVLNYVLGTSRSVVEALENLKSTQIVVAAGEVDILGERIYAGFGQHVVLRDRHGDSAVIEWLGGKTHYYYHPAFTDSVEERIDVSPFCVTYENTRGAVLTNAPSYGWHLANASAPAWLAMYTGNTNNQTAGLYMNGSALAGLPGDYTPPSRFVRGTVLERLMPPPRNQHQAIFAAKSIIQAVACPVGSNPSPTIWLSMADLKNAVYYFKPLVIPVTLLDQQEIAVDLIHLLDWREIRVRDLLFKPIDMVSLRVTAGTPITNDKTAKRILTEIAKPTGGEMEMHVHFVP